MSSLHDTIAAIASAPGGAARGIIRLSGQQTPQCLAGLFPAAAAQLAQTRLPSALAARLSFGQRAIDCTMHFWPSHRSYTREPAAELHLIGSQPLLQRTLAIICQYGVRIAEPGEFTLRAFLAGRLDLTQAEAVLGVIEARDRSQLNVALEQLAGGLSQPLNALREQLLNLLAHLEAGLDFVEEDIEFISAAELKKQLLEIQQAIAHIAQQMSERAVDSNQPRVVLRGAPNAGKSSLFNALLQREAAIVSDHAGTTRDYLLGTLDLGGITCALVDTAGVDSSALADDVQRAAQQLMHEQSQAADLEIFCLDGARPISDWELQVLSAETPVPRIIVSTKADLECSAAAPRGNVLPVSSRTGAGLKQLCELLREQLVESASNSATAVASTAARCREILQHAAEHLAEAMDIQGSGGGEELIAAELRLALDAVGRVVGAVYTDDVLDRIFSRFCIGK